MFARRLSQPLISPNAWAAGPETCPENVGFPSRAGFPAGLIWSGTGEVPAIGARVHIHVNNVGPGEVKAYFHFAGCLGVVVAPETMPAHLRHAQPAVTLSHVYGRELEARRPQPSTGGQPEAGMEGGGAQTRELTVQRKIASLQQGERTGTLHPHEQAQLHYLTATTAAEKRAAYNENCAIRGRSTGATEAERAAQRREMAQHLLESDLTGLLKPGKDQYVDPRDLSGRQLRVQPVVTAPARAKNKLAALKKIVSTDPRRPALMGVYFDAENKLVVATNGLQLVAIAEENMGEHAGRIINPTTGRPVTCDASTEIKYPEYLRILPVYQKRALVSDLGTLRNQLAGLVRANKQVGPCYRAAESQVIRAEVVVGTDHHYFDPRVLLHTLDALQATGTKTVEFHLPADKWNRPCLVVDADRPRRCGLLMPVTNSGPDSTEGRGSLKKLAGGVPHVTVLTSGTNNDPVAELK